MTDTSFVLLLLVIYCKILLIQGCGTPLDNCREQEYEDPIPDKAFIGKVIANKTVATPQLCRIQCYLKPTCVSYNFDQNSRNSPNCQLSSSDAETHPGDLEDRPGTIYQGTQNKCRDVTCPPLMECHSGYGPQGYRCTYPHKCCQVPKKRLVHFPRKSVEDYIKVNTTFNTSLTALTISLMVQVDTRYSSEKGASFSLATPSASNSLLLVISDMLIFFASGEKRSVNVALNDGKWHHICATWNTSGNWQVYIDGHIRHNETNLAKGKKIERNGIAIIGQDQDRMGGGFQQYQSFSGSLTSISLWDRVLSPRDGSFSFLTNFECHPQPGQVLSWEDVLKGEQYGQVKVL